MMKQLILLLQAALLVLLCSGDINPGSLQNDASTLEAQLGMLAQERQFARIVITQAHRTSRTAILDTIRSTGQALRQLPASNVPAHDRLYNLTKNVHSFIDAEVNELEKDLKVQINNALVDIDGRAGVVVEQFPALAQKSSQMFFDGVSEAILPNNTREKLEKFEAGRTAKFLAILDVLKSLSPSEAVEKFKQSSLREITALLSVDSPRLFDTRWLDRYSSAITQEQEERQPLYDILTKDLMAINRRALRDINAKIRDKEGHWQKEVRRLHQSVNMTLDSEAVKLSDVNVIEDVIRNTEQYDTSQSLSSLLQTIIDLLESELNYLEFLNPFLRQNNMLALVLLSLALVLVSALLLSPIVLFLRCKWQQYLVQQRRYEEYRARAARHCAYEL